MDLEENHRCLPVVDVEANCGALGGCGATALFAAVCDAYSFSSQEAVERTVDFRIRGIIRLLIAVVLLCACVWAAIKIT